MKNNLPGTDVAYHRIQFKEENLHLLDMDVLALSNLLQDPDLESNFVEKDDPLDNDKGIGLTPAFFGYNEGDETKFQNNLDCPNATVGSSVPCNNDREEPPYQLYYKQLVGAEDIFLGTEKSPASFDSTHIVLKVHFPECGLNDLQLNVTTNKLIVESPNRCV